mgnify:CR=1 FL=1
MDSELENNYKVLKEIQNNPNTSQRKLAKEVGFSLGKLNYCLKALQQKGLIKIDNFKKNPNKISYAFMIRKMKEYDELKKELIKEKKIY